MRRFVDRGAITSAWVGLGMAVAPHSLASQSALAVLREGGNAVEAMIAATSAAPCTAAATASTPLPHPMSATAAAAEVTTLSTTCRWR